MQIIVEIILREIGINSDNEYLLDEISGEVHREVQGTKLYLYPENLEQLALIDEDIRDIMLVTSFEEEKEMA